MKTTIVLNQDEIEEIIREKVVESNQLLTQNCQIKVSLKAENATIEIEGNHL